MEQILCRQCDDVIPMSGMIEHFTRRHPALLPKVVEMVEVVVEWTCPECNVCQQDSVHPELGPFISSTCGECGKVFSDSQLSEEDAQAWEAARTAAESLSVNIAAGV